MPFTTVRGTRFHTMELGSAARDPVVMLHGLFTGSLASWYLTSAPAISARRPVRLLDWRGHGLSERSRTGYGAAAMAADLDALTADLPPFTIVGHSYGCVAGLRFLQARRTRVRSMVLVEPPLPDGAGHAPGTTARPEAAALLGPAATSRRVRALVEDTDLMAELAAEPPVTDADLRDLAAVPCLVISGARSPYASAAARIRRACPAVRAHVLDGGHDLHVTHAADVTALLTGFLDARIPEAAHG